MPSDPFEHLTKHVMCTIFAVPAGPGMAREPRSQDYDIIADILEEYAQNIREKKTVPEGAAQSVKYEDMIVGWYTLLPNRKT